MNFIEVAVAGTGAQVVRATPGQAAAFFPRPPGTPPYRYARPPATGDGWATAPARDVGMDEALLAKPMRLADADPSVSRPALIHSLLVARRGKLVLEEFKLVRAPRGAAPGVGFSASRTTHAAAPGTAPKTRRLAV